MDAVIEDPPAGISMMGSAWDHDYGGRQKWIDTFAPIFAEHLRLLKPGRFGFVWSFPRTSHWTALALENAGFEIVDVFYHLMAHRRPKSKNALKIGGEPWWIVRKPGPCVFNLRVDDCRLGPGRHPTNVALDERAKAELDLQTGVLKSGDRCFKRKGGGDYNQHAHGQDVRPVGSQCITYGDQGGASRFFHYCGRASVAERNAGLAKGESNPGVAVKPIGLMEIFIKLSTLPGEIVYDGFAGTGSTGCAAVKLDRYFMGVELDEQHYQVAAKRIAHYYRQP